MPKKTLLILLAVGFAAIPPALLQAQNQDPQPVYRRQEALNLHQLFPDTIPMVVPRSVPLLDIAPTIQTPTCLNPGFAFNFNAYVAEIAQLRSYVLSEVQAVVQAAPLLLIESLFPEMATILKHLNNMSWLKLSLQASNCESLVRSMQDSKLIPPQTAYAKCLAEKINEGIQRDTAERACSPTLRQVYNIQKQANVANYGLVATSVEKLRELRDKQHFTQVASDRDLDEIGNMLGEITVSPDGKTVTAGAPVLNSYLNRRREAKFQIDRLIGICAKQLNTTTYCEFSQTDLNPAIPHLYMRFPGTPQDKPPTPLVRLDTLKELAALTSQDAQPFIDALEHDVAITRLKLQQSQVDVLVNEMARLEGSGQNIGDLEALRTRFKNEVATIEETYAIRQRLQQQQDRHAALIRDALSNRRQILQQTGAPTRPAPAGPISR